MSWPETVATAWHAIRAHSMRSLLTVLGILIGIAAVILTVGLGLGTQKDVAEDISALGSDLLIVTPGSSTDSSGMRGGMGSAATLTVADAEALASPVAVPDVSAVTAERGSSQSIEAGDANWTVTVTGVTGEWLEVRGRSLDAGDFVSPDSVAEVVLGPETATELFGTTNVVGRTVSIAGSTFDVVGVLAEAGSSAETNLDDTALISMTAMTSAITGGTDASVSTIYLK
ncbi:MAG: ABC transporter permease, partial [Cellulomonadaceae bacterium]